MENIYFKLIAQKSPNGLMTLMAVVEDTFFGETPAIFEMQCVKVPATIYTGTYPTVKFNVDTIKDKTEELAGWGAAGILTESEWYYKKEEQKDLLGISIKNNSLK